MISLLFSNPMFYFINLVLVVFSICCHEYAHARAALWQGDPTAANEGHLTLNPMIQMGPVSLALCAVIGVAFGAVPVNPANFRNKYSDVIVSFAGPFTNLLLFFAFAIFGGVVVALGSENREVMIFFFSGAALNVVLFIFNMLPIPIVDGGKIYANFFPMERFERANPELLNGLKVAVFFIALFSFEYIWRAGYLLAALVMTGVQFVFNLFGVG